MKAWDDEEMISDELSLQYKLLSNNALNHKGFRIHLDDDDKEWHPHSSH